MPPSYFQRLGWKIADTIEGLLEAEWLRTLMCIVIATIQMGIVIQVLVPTCAHPYLVGFLAVGAIGNVVEAEFRVHERRKR